MTDRIALPDGSEESKKQWGDYQYPGDVEHMKDHNKSFVIVLLVLVGIFVAITVNAIIRVKTWAITKPMDTHGFFCGFDNSKLVVKDAPNDFVKPNLVNYPYVFYDSKNISRQICVSKCPTRKNLPSFFNVKNKKTKSGTYLNNRTYDTNYYPDAQNTYEYKTRLVLNRCVPDLTIGGYIDLASIYSEEIKRKLDYLPKSDGTIDYIFNKKYTILICSASPLIICFVWILILKNFARCIGKTVVALVPLSLIGVCVFIFTSGSLVETILNREDIFSQAALQIIAVIALVIAALIIWFLIRIWSKVNLALSHIKLACKVFYNNFTKFILMRIIVLFIFILIGSIVLVSSAALYSIADFKYNIPDDGFFKGIGRITLDRNIVFFMLIYNIVFLVFIHYLLIHLCHYVTSAAIVKWYFTERKGNSHFGRISFHGIWFAWKKGLGTVTISCLIRTTLTILARQLANYFNKLPLTGIPFIITFINMLFRLTNFIVFVLATSYTTQHIFNTPWIPSAKLGIGFIASDKLFTIIFKVIVAIIDWVSFIGNFSIYVILFVVIDQIMGEGFNLFNSSLVLAVLFVILFVHVFRCIIDIIYACQQSEKSLPENTAGDVSKMENQIITETKDAPENADTNNQASAEKLEDKSEIKEE